MIKRFSAIILLFSLLFFLPLQSEASVFSKALEKCRKVMQSAFQLSFLPNVPVVFYKQSFNNMLSHTQNSIDNLNIEHQGQRITRNQFQNDKALHIKKSAELALHIKSLIGSAHLAYGITMVIGLLKEAVDGSFLNPSGSRDKADVKADHVGAMAVFGKQRFDNSLQKNLGTFIKNETPLSESPEISADKKTVKPDNFNPKIKDPFTADSVNTTQRSRQKLLKLYYEACERRDIDEMKRLADLLNTP
jgi:hypothetical protein